MCLPTLKCYLTYSERLKSSIIPLLFNVCSMAGFVLFGVIFSWLVKLSIVRFGGWKEAAVVRKYMILLYR